MTSLLMLPTEGRSPLNRWLKRLLIVAGVIAIGVVLRLTVLRPAAVPVTVYEVARGRVEETVVNSRAGTVKSRRRTQMSPGISGLVREIPVVKGERVTAGQVLLRIDDSEYRYQVTLAERSLDAARAAANEACLTADQTQRDLARTESLAQQGLASDQALESARTQAEGAQAACVAARERAKEAEASLAVARATLDKTSIVAPFDGVVLDITTEVGEWISPSPPGVMIPPVIDLIDPLDLYVSAPLDEADVAKVHLDLPTRITMDAFRGQSFSGHLSYISSYVETRQEQNRTLTVEAVFDEEALPPNLLPGLSADVEVILGAREDVLRVPTYALLEGDRVLQVRRNRLIETKVATGLRNWAFAEITDGLSEGNRVVVSLDRVEVKPGARVRVTSELKP
jgi:HlyD family secretion protein